MKKERIIYSELQEDLQLKLQRIILDKKYNSLTEVQCKSICKRILAARNFNKLIREHRIRVKA